MRYLVCLLVVFSVLGCESRDSTPAHTTTSKTPAPVLEGADVLAWLEADFQALLAEDPDAAAIKKVADQLTDASQLERPQYNRILSSLQPLRSRAAIPLLLKLYVIEVDSAPHPHDQRHACLQSLVMLTGENMAALQTRVEAIPAATEKLLREWYIPNYNTITTHVDAMTPPQVWRITEELIAGQPDYGNTISTIPGGDHVRGDARAYVDFAIKPYRNGKSNVTPQELSGKMLPYLLTAAGVEEYRLRYLDMLLPDSREGILATLAEVGQRKRYGIHTPLNYSVVPILAELRKAGLAPQLDEIVTDPGASPASRLVCALALLRVGEEVTADPMVLLIDEQEDLLFRLPAIAVLRYAKPSQAITEKLIMLLDAPEPSVVRAAILALEGDTSPEFVAKLGPILAECENETVILPALRALEHIKTQGSADAVAGFLSTALADPTKQRYLLNGMWAMEKIVGQSFRKRRSEDMVVRGAQAALTWWQENREAWPPR